MGFAPDFAIGFGAPFYGSYRGPYDAHGGYPTAGWSTAGPSGWTRLCCFVTGHGRPRGVGRAASALWRHVIDDKHPDRDAD